MCLARVFSTSSDLFLPYFCASISSVLLTNLSISFNFIPNDRTFYQSKPLQLMDPASTTVIFSFLPNCCPIFLPQLFSVFLKSRRTQLVYSTPFNAIAFILLSVFYQFKHPDHYPVLLSSSVLVTLFNFTNLLLFWCYRTMQTQFLTSFCYPHPTTLAQYKWPDCLTLIAPTTAPEALRVLTLTCLLLAVLSFVSEIKDSSFYRQRRIKKGRFGPRKNRKSLEIKEKS